MRLIPRDDEFFNLFNQLSGRLSASVHLLNQLFTDPSRLKELVTQIKDVEHEADNLTHEIIARINRSFVTPIDREDIYALASSLDDVIDLIDGIARRADMFHLRVSRPEAIKLTEVLVRCAVQVEVAVLNIKKGPTVTEAARELKRLEEEADAIYHQAVGDLFLGTPDPLDVIKWKELYDKLEDATDRAEDVASVLESISLKNA
jgi:predicted phosphate transport protein (TIGR00153 family)